MHIYKITNTANGRCYFGQTTQRPRARWIHHRSSLRRGVHKNPHLQRAWNKYGEAAFIFKVIESIENGSRRDLDALESRYLLLNPNAYNMSTVGPSRTMAEETKQKISLANKGRKLTEEHKRRVSEGNKGKKRSPEICAAMSESMKGRTFSVETRALWSKMRTGKKLNFTPESMARKRLINKGVSPANKGIPMAEEQKIKISAANTIAWAKWRKEKYEVGIEKRCFKCKEVLLLEYFHKSKSNIDGHNSACKECNKMLRKQYREKRNANVCG